VPKILSGCALLLVSTVSIRSLWVCAGRGGGRSCGEIRLGHGKAVQAAQPILALFVGFLRHLNPQTCHHEKIQRTTHPRIMAVSLLAGVGKHQPGRVSHRCIYPKDKPPKKSKNANTRLSAILTVMISRRTPRTTRPRSSPRLGWWQQSPL
jgi:hypothetical protein